MDDYELLGAVISGSGRAFEALYARYVGLVKSVAFRRLKNWADAEEAAQETFLALALQARRMLQLRGARESLAPLLSLIAQRRALDLVRRRVVRRALPLTGGEPGGARKPEDLAMEHEEKGLLERKIAGLAEKEREVVVGRLEGRSYRELAGRLGRPEATLRVCHYRAVAKLVG
jgi:RNA polymerase sigma-70 factor, ECF subfamily